MRESKSQVAKFPGTVKLPDALTFPQLQAWENAFGQADVSGDTYILQARRVLPAICEIVQEWHITGIPDNPTPETFPATPPRAVAELLGWLIGLINDVVRGDTDSPNA